MSACLERPRSQPRKSARSFAALSILLTELAPHEVHLHRVLPALVLPFRFIFAPQRGAGPSLHRRDRLTTNLSGRFSIAQPVVPERADTHFVQAGSWGGSTQGPSFPASACEYEDDSDTLFVL